VRGETRLSTFEDFWPFYLGEYSRAATRALHAAGTTGGVLLIGAALAARRNQPLAKERSAEIDSAAR
jgi:hypothetical protein